MTAIRIIRTPALLLAVAALLLAGLALPAHAAARTGSVKGVVALDGKPLKGLRIELHLTGDDGFENTTLAVDTTDSKGAYSFTFDTADPEYSGHTIIIRDSSYGIVTTSRKFTDRPGRTVTRNASVKQAGSIVGSVKRGDDVATHRIRIDVFGPSDSIDHDRDLPLSYDESVFAATDGSFALRGLPAGDYWLGFDDESNTYFEQCYDNTPITVRDCDGRDGFPSSGTPVSVAAGQNVSLNPQVLSTRGRRILGTVTDTSGRPIKYAVVTAVREAGQEEPLGDESFSTGAFTIGPLPDGRYRLSVSPLSPWASQWYDRKTTRADATPFDIDGHDVTGVAIKLKSKASIRAAFTPGTGTLKVAADVTRSATGSKPSGMITIRWGSVSKTVAVVKGKAAVKLSGLPKGRRLITLSYAGTYSTAAATKQFHAVVN